MPHLIPPELLATTPPMFAISVEAGSGPSLRPWGARTRLAWPRIIPGPIEARAPSSRTSIPPKFLWTSISIPSVWLCPLRLDPPARKTTGISFSLP